MKIKNRKKIALFACVGVLAAMPFALGNTSSSDTVVDDGTLLNRTIVFKNEIDFYEVVGGMGSLSYNLDFFVNVNGVRYVYDELTFAQDLYANGGSQMLYDSMLVYNSVSHNDVQGWLDSNYSDYGTITIVGGADVQNVDLLNYVYLYGSGYIDSISVYTPPAENLDLFDQIYDILNDYLFDGQITQESMSYKNLLLIAGASVLSFLIISVPFIAVFAILRLFFK